MIGDRLRSARTASGLSLRALAERVGVSHQAIHKYETNQDVPSSSVLIHLSKELNVKPEFFFRRDRNIGITPAFRKHAPLSARAERQVMSRVAEALERRLELEELTHSAADARCLYAISADHLDSYEDIEVLADRLRTDWNLGTAPIDNLTEVLEDRGVRIEVVSDVDSGFDACGFWAEVRVEEAHEHELGSDRNSRIPVVAVCFGVPGDRQRFSLAHEIGHLVLELAFRDSEASGGNAEALGMSVEAAANRFAGALLVPRAAALQELGARRRDLSFSELYLLKHKYGFSIQAWIHRAAELGIISKETEKRLFRHIGALGWRKIEPGQQVAPETPTRSRQMAFRAISEGMISKAKAAELLGLSAADMALEGV